MKKNLPTLYLLLAGFGICQGFILLADLLVFLSRTQEFFGGKFYQLVMPYPFGHEIELPQLVRTMLDTPVEVFIWVRNLIQNFVNKILQDPYNITSFVIVTAIIEEAFYRGPLVVLRKYFYCSIRIWVLIAIFLNVWFLLNHHAAPIFLLCIAGLSVSSTWLAYKTGKIWPSIVLHMVYNLDQLFGGVTISRM